MARTLTSLLGCKHECKWATQAIEVEEKKKKKKRKKKKRKKNTHTDTRAHAHTRSERERERERRRRREREILRNIVRQDSSQPAHTSPSTYLG